LFTNHRASKLKSEVRLKSTQSILI
jgi:hypothetical protein